MAVNSFNEVNYCYSAVAAPGLVLKCSTMGGHSDGVTVPGVGTADGATLPGVGTEIV